MSENLHTFFGSSAKVHLKASGSSASLCGSLKINSTTQGGTTIMPISQDLAEIDNSFPLSGTAVRTIESLLDCERCIAVYRKRYATKSS